MTTGEKKELTFRQMLGLTASMPAWASVILAVFGLALFSIELLNGRFEIGAIYFLLTGLGFAHQVYKERTVSPVWTIAGMGWLVFTVLFFAVTQYLNVQW